MDQATFNGPLLAHGAVQDVWIVDALVGSAATPAKQVAGGWTHVVVVVGGGTVVGVVVVSGGTGAVGVLTGPGDGGEVVVAGKPAVVKVEPGARTTVVGVADDWGGDVSTPRVSRGGVVTE
jgi:hypothetical protein